MVYKRNTYVLTIVIINFEDFKSVLKILKYGICETYFSQNRDFCIFFFLINWM